MKKALTYLLISALLLAVFSFWVNAVWFDPKDILPTTGEWTITDVKFESSTWLLDQILTFVKDSIFGILALVAIGMFLYVWFSLIKAQWNPEELKKAFMTLIHVIIWLFIIAISWAVIKMVSSITF